MGLEPMTPAVTGRYSIQLSYETVLFDAAKIAKDRHTLQIYFDIFPVI